MPGGEVRDVRAAGAVVTRKRSGRKSTKVWEVLLVHRPKYDDWSFPKGKLDPGEHEVTAAVREVAEETGLDVRLGPALSPQRYRMATGRWKRVDYWTAKVLGSDDVSGYRPNDEIDAVEWVPWEAAPGRLTYSYDRDTLAEARPLRRRTHALVVLRHGKARSREAWRKDDRLRPLVRLGESQAERLVPLLAAFDVTAAHTSSSERCLQTVRPYVEVTGWPSSLHDGLTEEEASAEGVIGLVDSLLRRPEGVVLCTHRPVLPTVIDALGVPDVELETAEMLVVHHRKGRIVATERRRP